MALALPFVLAQAIAALLFVLHVNLPLVRSATEDLATLIVLSVDTWHRLPVAQRADYQQQLDGHGLQLAVARGPLPGEATVLPYPAMLQDALQRHLGGEARLTRSESPPMYWVDVVRGDTTIRVGFHHDRVEPRPLTAFWMMLGTTLLATLLTALLLARWMTRPLERLAQAAEAVGKDRLPEPLPESGPRELAALAARFNRMAREVRELIDGRTTLLAGVSHDLRTPLARLRISLAMLPESTDPDVIADIERDVEQMDRLIGQHLHFARGAGPASAEPADIAELIDEAVGHLRRRGVEVAWQAPGHCVRAIDPLALRRIVDNLLENAARHGEGAAVEVQLRCAPGHTTIRVLDRGPGIGQDETESLFRPFQRARNVRTPGSGLGLAIVRQLSEANGWKVELQQRDGGGTEARVDIAGNPPTSP